MLMMKLEGCETMKDMIPRFSVAAVIGALILLMGMTVPAGAKETLEVVRDKDKTSYVIDSDDSGAREEERDKERAWQMLQNGGIWVDGRSRGRPPQPNNR